MVAFNSPIAWLLESLRLWRQHEPLAPDSTPAADEEAADVQDEHNTTVWYTQPPN